MSSQLLAISFDSAASPSITLKPGEPGSKPAAGWGFAWYPMDDGAAVVVKDPNATHETPLTRTLRDWDRFRSCVFLCHTHGAARRITQQDTHPFQRSYAGRDWVFAHSGELDPLRLKKELPIDAPALEPLGTTDSEHAFCWLLMKIRDAGARSLADIGWDELHAWLRRLNQLGVASFLFSDGHDIVAYCDESGDRPFYRIRRTPPHEKTVLDGARVRLDVGDPYDINRTMAIIARNPLSEEEGWDEVEPGEMVVARRGVFTWRSDGDPEDGVVVRGGEPLWTERESGGAKERDEVGPVSATPAQARENAKAKIADIADDPRAGRVLRVEHETIYTYEEPVELSTHTFRLHPVHDPLQDVIDYQLEISPPGAGRRAEDVFGNRVLNFKLERPYRQLWIRATSHVRVRRPMEPDSFRRSTIPLVWMPWQRQMMMPYLLPQELPETQLRALSDYAMSFVERNDYDLVETLDDINRTINRDFNYVPGSTLLETSPFTVFVRREGVCQDFANLFICLCQLIAVPARYQVGYIYTAANYANQIQSEASHAWAEVYLPDVGWRGYDPTNGVRANLDHVRVAHGRNYREATPTSGTLFKGGSGEKLDTSVKVEVVE